MHHRVELATQRAGLRNRLVGYGERRVERDGAPHVRPLVALQEAAALGQAAAGFVAAVVALGRSVPEKRAHAELVARVRQHVERSLDEIG